MVSVTVSAILAVSTLVGSGLADAVLPATRARALAIEQRSAQLEQSMGQIKNDMTGLAEELKAYTFIDRRLRDLLRARCMGAKNLDAAIVDWERKYQKATGEPYVEPSCDALMVSRE